MLCPSDRGTKIHAAGLAPTNYMVNVGSGRVNNGSCIADANGTPDGISYQGSAVRIADVSDGTSRTLAFGESLIGLGTSQAPYQSVTVQHLRNAPGFPACPEDRASPTY